MTFADNKHKEINEALNNGMVISNSIGGAHVYDGNWAVCKVEDLDKMIARLQEVKATIEEKTGVII